jgi:hypothetical protein
MEEAESNAEIENVMRSNTEELVVGGNTPSDNIFKWRRI